MKATCFRLLGIAAILLAVVSAATCGTVVVKPSNMQGWVTAVQQGTGSQMPYVSFVAYPPGSTGVGSLELHNFAAYADPQSKAYAGTNNHTGVPLSQITSFKYRSYLRWRDYGLPGEASGTPYGQPVMMELTCVNSADPAQQQRTFVYKPYGVFGMDNQQPLQWQEFDLMAPGGRWELLHTSSTNQYGDWNWVLGRYANLTLSAPYVGDYTQTPPTGDYHVYNQTGTSIALKVGSGKTLEKFTWWKGGAELFPWWKEGADIRGYVDQLVIGINGVETVYDFEPELLDSIKAVKNANDSEGALIASKIVTATYRGASGEPIGFAIEESDRSAGIRVNSDIFVNPGDRVTVQGQVSTQSFERIIAATSVILEEPMQPIPEPLNITTRDAAGGPYGKQVGVVDDAIAEPDVMACGANNVGLLVTIRGRVTKKVEDPMNPTSYYSNYFYVDDAYSNPTDMIDTGIKDGSGYVGIRCRPAVGDLGLPAPMPDEGDYVAVTGQIGVVNVGGKPARYMWTKSIEPATTANQTISLAAGWNLFALPIPAQNPDPVALFGGDGSAIDGRLYGWDACGQSLILFDMWAPGSFGALWATDGYWVKLDSATSISYTGYAENNQDWWISAPAGWKIISNPFTHDTVWDDWKANDGADQKSLYDASYGAGWLQSTGYLWDETVQGLVDFGVADDFPTTSALRTKHGHWVKTYQTVGLIAPADSNP